MEPKNTALAKNNYKLPIFGFHVRFWSTNNGFFDVCFMVGGNPRESKAWWIDFNQGLWLGSDFYTGSVDASEIRRAPVEGMVVYPIICKDFLFTSQVVFLTGFLKHQRYTTS